MCYSAPSTHRNWTVKRRHKMLSASIFILWEWWVRFKEHLHTSAVLHLKETLNNWRLRAEMASWSACIKLWGLDPGLKNTYTNLYITVFLKKIRYFVLSKLIARDITLYNIWQLPNQDTRLSFRTVFYWCLSDYQMLSGPLTAGWQRWNVPRAEALPLTDKGFDWSHQNKSPWSSVTVDPH